LRRINMSRKDFELIAEIIRGMPTTSVWYHGLSRAPVARRFAQGIVKHHPRFRLAWFYRACGLDDNGVERDS
jgi:hypothetical protein